MMFGMYVKDYVVSTLAGEPRDQSSHLSHVKGGFLSRHQEFLSEHVRPQRPRKHSNLHTW